VESKRDAAPKKEWKAKLSNGEGTKIDKANDIVDCPPLDSNLVQTSVRDPSPEGFEPIILKKKPQEERLAFPPSNEAQDPNYNQFCSLASPELTIDLSTIPETPRGSLDFGGSEAETEQEGFSNIGKKKKSKNGEKPVLPKPSMTTRRHADVGKITAHRGRRSEQKTREDETQQNLADGTQLTIHDVLSPKSSVSGRSAGY
jgi:hypothetical protein